MWQKNSVPIDFFGCIGSCMDESIPDEKACYVVSGTLTTAAYWGGSSGSQWTQPLGNEPAHPHQQEVLCKLQKRL